MHVARMQTGQQPVTVPDAPFVHLFVARGAIEMEGVGALHEGDAVRLRGGGQRLTTASEAEVIVWEMHATVAE